ncbi:PKD domain-containing protein (plasmid) [Pseudoalteromonas sp. T1lg65]|uniref:PKD domain-containing protein n=1 Tax=Pseudoalteromonas sp. T1lg65 TaxID=2077101 RepID=UPI003F796CCA
MKWKNSFPISFCMLLAACGGSGTSDAVTKVNTGESKSNQRPVAVITQSSPEIKLNSIVRFSAAKSYDNDGDSLTYSWNLVKGTGRTPITLEQASSKELALELKEADEYVLSLIASDGKSNSSPSELVIKLEDNFAVVAQAGRDLTVKKGQIVSLDGTSSYAVEGVLTSYEWKIIEQPDNSTARIYKYKRPKTSFVPDAVGQYVVELTVKKSTGESAKDTVTITSEAHDVNTAPVVVLKQSKTKLEPDEVTLLDASESYDPDRLDRLSFGWEITSQPEGAKASLSDLHEAQTSFSAETIGDYEVTVSVTDSSGATSKAAYFLSITTDNLPPVVSLGYEMTIPLKPKELVCASCYDPEGLSLTYQWRLISRPALSEGYIGFPTEEKAILSPDVEGTYIISLTVSDGQNEVTSNTQTFNVVGNHKPIARISGPETAYVDLPIELDGTKSSDPDNDTLTYEWQFIEAASNVQMTARDNGTASFIPTAQGNYVVSLRVNDGQSYSDVKTHLVQVKDNLAPVIVLENDRPRTIHVGEQIHFNASKSYDPEGDALSYQWRLEVPQGSGAQLSSELTSDANFVADIVGTYSVIIELTDSAGNKSSTVVRVDASDPIDMVSGRVRGSFIDPMLNRISNAGIIINGQSYTSDRYGNFDIYLEAEKGTALILETDDARLAKSFYTSPKVSQDGFRVNFGEERVPYLQPLSLIVQVCDLEIGADSGSIDIGVRMLSPMSDAGNFVTSFNELVNIKLDERGGGNRIIKVPAKAKYELYVADDLNIVIPSNALLDVYFSYIEQAGFAYICNK